MKGLKIDLGIFLILIFVLLAIWRIKKGFHDGMVKEIVNILSAIVSCVCIVLIFFVITSVRARTFSTLTLCVVTLIGIGILFKLFNLIFKPVTAIVNISIINGLDKFLGAILGFVEAVIFTLCLYCVLRYAGIAISFIK